MDIKKIVLVVLLKCLALFSYGQTWDIATGRWVYPSYINTGVKKSFQIGDGVGIDSFLIKSLSGSGTKMLIVDNNGLVSSQPIPSGDSSLFEFFPGTDTITPKAGRSVAILGNLILQDTTEGTGYFNYASSNGEITVRDDFVKLAYDSGSVVCDPLQNAVKWDAGHLTYLTGVFHDTIGAVPFVEMSIHNDTLECISNGQTVTGVDEVSILVYHDTLHPHFLWQFYDRQSDSLNLTMIHAHTGTLVIENQAGITLETPNLYFDGVTGGGNSMLTLDTTTGEVMRQPIPTGGTGFTIDVDENMYAGTDAMQSLSGGLVNFAAGIRAGATNIDGSGITCVGYQADVGFRSDGATAIGFSCSASTGGTAIGSNSNAGRYAIALGSSAYADNYSLETGDSILVWQAQVGGVTDLGSAAVPFDSLFVNSLLVNNTGIGGNSMLTIDTTTGEVMRQPIPSGTGFTIDVYDNMYSDNTSLTNIIDGTSNLAIGRSSGLTLIHGGNNILIGNTADVADSSTQDGISIGISSGVGTLSVAVGGGSYAFGTQCVVVGSSSSTGAYNNVTALGYGNASVYRDSQFVVSNSAEWFSPNEANLGTITYPFDSLFVNSLSVSDTTAPGAQLSTITNGVTAGDPVGFLNVEIPVGSGIIRKIPYW